ncbi:hypothetical protein CA51_35390 [Rosistilla oblonga]|uniref:Hemin uptake protein hemP n=1 Tax=Rosistilla oblonga TaxID=2527990 RepID=A0A518IYJ4_9BACT|nr:hemin uptake protein HemP [Rosistilla oblonga]QDV13648.1 hypothetical protein CA51_35390 [Rosistilla oblonga]QDV58163.1 hypothetical protein Mal33_41800 [Rosistilla oblonga]
MDSPSDLAHLGETPILPKVFEFAALSGDRPEVWIELDGITYRLRKTRQGKLILTK